ncbi:MAG: MmgE/PrpD family protein, partial [Nitriliruptorales bacterium]|nr:MmgE/PrpD family protein [Nitriliruptorales bacterium]
MSATAELSAFVADLDLSRVPDDVVHQAKRCLIDWLGVTLHGATDPGVQILLDMIDEVGAADGQATVLGRGRRVSLPFAALINGFASHVDDYDDTYNPAATTVHGSAPVWPVVLALAERTPTSGASAL